MSSSPSYVTDSEDEERAQRRKNGKQHLRIMAHSSDRIYVLMYRPEWTMAELRMELMRNPRTAGNVVPRDGRFQFRYASGSAVRLLAREREAKLLARDLNRRELAIFLNDPDALGGRSGDDDGRPHVV